MTGTHLVTAVVLLARPGSGDEITDPTADWITPLGKDPVSGMVSFEVDGVRLTCVGSEGSLQPDTAKAAIAAARTWPDAETAMARVTHQIVVGANERVSGHAAVARAASAVSRLAAEYLDGEGGTAIYWPSSGALMPAEMFVEAARDRTELSIGLVGTWVHLNWFRSEGPDQSGARLAVSTKGLASFVAREIDFEPSDLNAVQIAEQVLYTARHLIEAGAVFKDGDTIGTDENARYLVGLLDTGYGGGPTYRLSKLPASAQSSP